jgi:hypothetical protein
MLGIIENIGIIGMNLLIYLNVLNILKNPKDLSCFIINHLNHLNLRNPGSENCIEIKNLKIILLILS